jgi:hypothetical protein
MALLGFTCFRVSEAVYLTAVFLLADNVHEVRYQYCLN